MKRSTVFPLAAIVAAVLLSAPPGWSQTPGTHDFRLLRIRQQLRPPPQFGGSGEDLGGYSTFGQKSWLQIEVTFRSEPEWADNVALKFYVLAGQGRDTRLFTSTQTFNDLRRAPQHFAAVFVHPNTLDRYGMGRIDAVAVQLFYQDKLIDQESQPKTTKRWWEDYSPITAVLRPPGQTPWALIAYTRYEEPRLGPATAPLP